MKKNDYLGMQIWLLNTHPLYKDKEFQLDWGSLFDLSLGTVSQRKQLLWSAQQFYLANWGIRSEGRWQLSPNAMLAIFDRFRGLCGWMARNSVWRFSDISAENALDFMGSRQPRGKTDRAISERHFNNLIDLFQRLWDSRGKYKNPIGFNLEDYREELVLTVRTRPDRVWKSIDEGISLKLIGVALDWIEKYGAFCHDLIRKDHLLSVEKKGQIAKHRILKRRAFYHEIEQSDIYNKMKGELRVTENFSVKKTIALGFTVLEGACAYLVLILVGMRISELIALDVNCVIRESQGNGTIKTFISGIAAKKSGLARKWVAGEAVSKVIEFLQKISEASGQRKLAKARPLFLMRIAGSFFPTGRDASRWTTKAARGKLQKFVSSQCRRQGASLNIFHPHMTRKSFAQLAVLRDKSMLGPVAAQFGHVYKEFTDGRYVGTDHELSKLLDGADRKELTRRLEHLLTCDQISGGAAPALKRIREEVSSFRGKKTLHSLVKKLVEGGTKLAPCDWGYCVYAKVFSLCGGDEKGPNEIGRSPEVCAGCQNFIVTNEHRPWWEERVVREGSFSQLANLPEQTKILAKTRLLKSQEVLGKLISSTYHSTSDGK